MKVILSEYSSGFSDYSSVLCNELSKHDHINQLIYLSDDKNPYFKQIDERVEKHKLFISFKTDDKYKKGSIMWALNRWRTAVKNCQARNKFVLTAKPDCILVQATLSRFDSKYLKALKGKTRIVLTVHDVVVPTNSKSWSKKALKRMYDIADKMIVHSLSNKEDLVNQFNIEERKISIIPHGVKSDYIKLDKEYCKKQLHITDDLPILLFYGSIRDSKGLDVLINSLKGIDCRLIIAGAPFYGESFDGYRVLIEQNKIKTTEFIEYTDDAFRDVLFQACDYVVLPYREFSSQSGVFMQAIQYRKPIIATDVSAFKEYIDKYDIGYVCAPNDVKDLQETIKRCLSINRDYSVQMQEAIDDNKWTVVGDKYAKELLGE